MLLSDGDIAIKIKMKLSFTKKSNSLNKKDEVFFFCLSKGHFLCRKAYLVFINTIVAGGIKCIWRKMFH